MATPSPCQHQVEFTGWILIALHHHHGEIPWPLVHLVGYCDGCVAIDQVISHLISIAGDHPQSHSIRPPRSRSDVVLLRGGALEAVCLDHHLHHQSVVETDDAQESLFLLRSVADEYLYRGKGIAGEIVLVEA